MSKKIGVYVPGLGESYRKESAEKYAARLMHELDYNNTDSKLLYRSTVEKLPYDASGNLFTQQIIISEEKDNVVTEVYRLYEYQYASVLTSDFEKKNVFLKSLSLFCGVIAKLPVIILRVFYIGHEIGYRPRYRGEAFFIFLVFLLMSLSILFLLPSALGLLLTTMNEHAGLKNMLGRLDLSPAEVKKFSQVTLNITALILILMPGANTVVTALATEFSCATGYLHSGDRKQKIHGQIDRLIEFICEREGDDAEITFHSYSFGSIVILDYLFPFGIEPSTRVQKNVKGLITIGCPYDFVRVYFKGFFRMRDTSMAGRITWINVYSLADALASNFRKSDTTGNAEYGMPGSSVTPVNLNYEVTNVKPNIIFQLLSLYSIRSHAKYWDTDDDGQSCLGTIVKELKQRSII